MPLGGENASIDEFSLCLGEATTAARFGASALHAGRLAHFRRSLLSAGHKRIAPLSFLFLSLQPGEFRQSEAMHAGTSMQITGSIIETCRAVGAERALLQIGLSVGAVL